ncbi:hypothetical protein D9615_009740 [Tricholomella constricta]|uniref:HAT C-terminal dimerisation domain-containing protein n=1 Tax=Tricholomella constricta TaxID=117010 RepID=A0A8H5LUV4_9AGAR|nr:hypothetical protein D9615_009740 [Tricholomella constricta]
MFSRLRLPFTSLTSHPVVPDKSNGQYGYSWIRNAVRARVDAEHTQASPRDELKRYLESPLEKVEDVIGYWGKHSGPSHYPTLARLARDYLAIQGSATPSERAFSSGGLTGVALRNRLTVEAFEALQLLKSAYRNGHIDAGSEAEKHLETFSVQSSTYSLDQTSSPVQSSQKFHKNRTEPDFGITSEDDYTESEIATYGIIIKLIPSYAKVLSACIEDASMFELFIKELATAATRSRTNDTATMKSQIASYILPSKRLHLLLKKPWHPLDPETQRGWDDEQCSLLLTPLRLLSTFFEDPITFMQKVQNGEIKIKAKEFPSFLYPEGTEYIMGNEFDGLMRGPLLLRAFLCIFCGPLAAFNRDKRGNKPSQAEKHGMTTVEPRAIAYAAVHARMALSGLGWTLLDGFFNNETFFDNVANMFLREPDSVWAKETLAWWNSQVSLVRSKKNSKSKELVDDDSDDGLGDPVSRILAQAAAAEGRAASSDSGNAALPKQAQLQGGDCGGELELGDQQRNPNEEEPRAMSTTQIPSRTSSPVPSRTSSPVPPLPSTTAAQRPAPRPTEPRLPTPPRSSSIPPPVETHPLPTIPNAMLTQPPSATPATQTTSTGRAPLQESSGFNLPNKRSGPESESELSEEEPSPPAKKVKKKPVPATRKRGGNRR